MKPTDEQDAIIAARRARPDGYLRVDAKSGSGKTSTLIMLGENDPRPSLYLAYNSPIVKDAEKRFSGNVNVRTSHSVAFRAMRMHEQKHRLDARLMGRDVASRYAIPALDGYRASQWGQWVIETVRNFTYSADPQITLDHVADLPPKSIRQEPVLRWATQLWREMCDPSSMVPIEHDTYLKLFSLRGARLPFRAEVIYFDEAQDCNACTLQILRQIRIPTVFVGDGYQNIYAFRKTINAMRTVKAPSLPLSQSWRYGPVVAQIANAILSHTSVPPETMVRGNMERDTTITTDALKGKHAVLCRTNAGVFEAAITGTDRIHILGGAEPLVKLLMGGYRLWQGEMVHDVASLCRFRAYDEMVEYAEEANDAELKLLHELVTEHGQNIPNLADSIKTRAVDSEEAAARVIGTGHKSKGREWDQVELWNDFHDYDDLFSRDENGRDKWTPEKRDQELHLNYVTSTRCRFKLRPNTAVKSLVHAWRRDRGRFGHRSATAA